jgi:rhodanese-related sulfurtransferase
MTADVLTGRVGDGPPPDLAGLLDRVRAGYRRLEPAPAADAVAAGALLIDIRPDAERSRDGRVPGAIVIERTALEWRLAPSSEQRIPQLQRADQTVIVLSAEGDASTLAAASLRALGLSGATDVVGGFTAWRRAGLPVAAVHRDTALPFAAV